MTDPCHHAVLSPSGSALRAARRPRLRVGLLLACMALVVVCSVAVVLGQGNSGSIVRIVTVGPLPYNSLTVDEQTGRAFVFNRGTNTLSVLDTRTGSLLRTVSVGIGFAWMAVSPRTGHVFLMSGGEGSVSMLDARSGMVLRTVTDQDLDTRQIVVDDRTDHVFVGHRDSSTVTMLDTRTGAILRHLTVCAGPFALGSSERTGHLFAKCNDGTTDMLDARTGRVVHRNAVNSGTYCGVLVDESTNRVFETGNGVTDLLDAQTGVRLKGLPAINPVDCVKGFAVNDRTGLVYASLSGINGLNSTVKDVVVVVDGRTGAILRRIPVPANPISLALDSQTGRVVVGSAGPLDSSGSPTTNGTVSVLDGTTGRVLRAVQVGFTPTDIAIDALRRRALVVSSYTDVNGADTEISWRPQERWWPQVLRRIKQVICCLPFQAPAPPDPTTDGTVTTIDLTRV